MNTDKQPASPQFAAQFSHRPPAPSPQPTPVPGEPVKFPSAFSLFQPSTQLVIKNLTNFIVIYMLPTVYYALMGRFFDPKTANHHLGLWLGLMGIGTVYNLVILGARPLLALGAVNGRQFGLLEVIKAGGRYFWRLLGLYIVLGAVFFIGIVLFIVPGIIMIRRYALASYFLVDQNTGIFEAMRRSAAATKGYTGAVWGLIGVQVLVGSPGWIPFIGPFLISATTMLYACAPAMRYEQFKALHTSKPHASVPPNPVGN